MLDKTVRVFVIIALLAVLLPKNSISGAETPNVTFTISNSSGSLLNGALVKIYSDFLRTTFADDLLQAGDNDANKETVIGEASFRLTAGSHEYIVESLGSNSIYGTLDITEGTKSMILTLAKTGAAVIAPHRSYFTLTGAPLPADGATLATIDVLLRSNDNTGLNGYDVTMVSARGNIDVFNTNPKATTSGGRAQFLLKSSVPGKAKLYAKVGNVRLATNTEVIFTGEATPSSEKSTLTLATSTVQVGTATNLVVILRSLANDSLSNRTVVVTSDRTEDQITPAAGTTDANGQANFSILSTKAGTSALTIKSGTIIVGTASLTFNPMPLPTETLPSGISAGTLVKSADNPAVYYVGRDGKRHPFPNEKIYFTWYKDFSSVKTVGAADLASMSLGKNVTYRAGVRMIKLQTIPKVYAVARGSVLRWIQTEALATSLYGAAWNKKIDDLSDAFFVNYTEGEIIDDASDFNPGSETAGTMTIDEQLGL